MQEGIEVWRGGVNTWECDEMGHLNVRFWVAKALQGLVGLAREMGMPHAFAPDAEATLVLRDLHMRFLREARPGAALDMTGGVVSLDECEARLLLVIRHVSGEPAATFQCVVAHATPRDLRAFPWPQRVRSRAEGLRVEVPPHAAARSIDLSPVAVAASLNRAEELGLMRIGLSAIGPGDLDAFGRMRPEIFIGQVSDGVARLFDRPPPALKPGGSEPRIGGAVLEYRAVFADWPRAGDAVEVRSGFAECAPKTRRVFHWMVDPVSGKPWVSSEAVVISFDLDARKVVELTPEAMAAFQARVAPGLSY
ncbi:MAG: thioesterase family protein [Phenylobacterium sp.]|uniref:thioesterase family protein n=1 Tax=Phenylobacterium sp. TaxID=1871053 RepID=UPI00391C4FBD